MYVGEFGGQNAHSTLNTNCELGVSSPHWHYLNLRQSVAYTCRYM